MKRYYYTDPLAAAWMAKHFGMRFSNEGLYDAKSAYACHINASGWSGGGGPVDIICSDRGRYKFYIHPDSLPLLQTKEGDQIYNACEGSTVNVSDIQIFDEMSVAEAQKLIDESIFEISRRWLWKDNQQSKRIQFFWPEVEQ